MAEQFQIVLCTCPDMATAQKIAHLLIEQRLAACINIIPQIVSLYRWEGKIVEDAECLLMIKTSQQCYAQLEQIIQLNHSYKIPEIIALPIQQGLSRYFTWLESELKE